MSLRAEADGRLAGRAPVIPFMAPRLEGELVSDGRLAIGLWGRGRVADLRIDALEGEVRIGPNQVSDGVRSLHVAQSAPVLLLRGFRSVRPARRVHDGRASAAVRIEARGADVFVAAGADERELAAALRLDAAAVVGEAEAHAAECDRLPNGAPLERALVMTCAHAALASARRASGGGFAGLSAGLGYAAPARTYYRDGYWTALALADIRPDLLARQARLLAEGVGADGKAPSGLLMSADGASGRPAGDWWSDHFDSPLMFVLLVDAAVAAGGDPDLSADMLDPVRRVFERYERLAEAGEGLPRKPRNDRDWADNVYRSGLVAYDLGLWAGALDAIARLAATADPELAARARARRRSAAPRIVGALWLNSGWCADYVAEDGFVEDHLALDSLMLLRFDALDPERSRRVLDAVAARLETRAGGRHGDWGVMCAAPPYRRRADLRAKSAFPLRYHNGGDWPWLDAVYADERLRRGLGGWRYPLVRWFEHALARGWPGAVEHASPVYGRGSLMQGWSGLPGAVLARALNGQPRRARG